MPTTNRNRNLLDKAFSPYLLQHADNPVHWREWDSEAFDEAKRLNKPILLSIGYAACHWCHVMAHESFEDPAIASLMNDLFVNIKVDREERPDIDQIYMAALHAMGEQGGWPLTAFLTPEGAPFWGGTYFPPVQRFGRPGFPQVLSALSRAYHEDQNRVSSNTAAIVNHLTQITTGNPGDEFPPATFFDHLSENVLKMHDPVNGGVGTAPKFPNIPMLEVLARSASIEKNPMAERAFVLTMERISNGGIYDHIGGGLCRYSVDERWLVPHFEKMLYDNAHYIRSLTWAWQLTGNDLFRRRIESTYSWLTREMLLDGGAFASSLDADSEGEEGKYYVWAADELRQLLKQDFKKFAAIYDVSEAGNWEGVNIPNLLDQNTSSSPNNEMPEQLEMLLTHRAQRIPPSRDDKILVDWNGYLIRALAEASTAFNEPKYFQSAVDAYCFISESLAQDGRLPHSHRQGSSKFPAMASDYGAMIAAALSLFEISGDPDYINAAQSWLTILEDEYSDGDHGYYLSSELTKDLIIRPRCDHDDANPAASALILESLVRLANLADDQTCLAKAEQLASNIYRANMDTGYGLAGYANALHEFTNHRHVTLYGDSDRLKLFVDTIWAMPRLALSNKASDHKTGTHLGVPITGQPTQAHAILCSQMACSTPITSPEMLKSALIG